MFISKKKFEQIIKEESNKEYHKGYRDTCRDLRGVIAKLRKELRKKS